MKSANGWLKVGKSDVRASFRVHGILEQEIPQWENMIGDLVADPVKVSRRDGMRFVSVGLESKTLAKKLAAKVKSLTIVHSFGIHVSIVADTPAIDIDIPSFIMDFYREVGGEFDLSFVAFREETP